MTLLTKSVFISQVLLFHQTLGHGSFDYSGDRIRGGNKCWLIKGQWVVHHVWSLTALQTRSWTFRGKTVIYTVIYRQGHILDSIQSALSSWKSKHFCDHKAGILQADRTSVTDFKRNVLICPSERSGLKVFWTELKGSVSQLADFW